MPSMVTPMDMPERSSPSVWVERSISEGFLTSRRPRWHISYMPSSDVDPNRFLMARSRR